MKRILAVICVGISLLLVFFIIFRIATGRKFVSAQQPNRLRDVQQMADYFNQVKTRPLSLADFSNAVRERAGKSVSALPEEKRKKLFACINKFYSCYSSGKFDQFKQFRLRPPFTMSKKVSFYFKRIAAAKGINLNSMEDILRFGWNYKNGTNIIVGVSEKSVELSVTNSRNVGTVVRLPRVAAKWPWLNGEQCWDAGIVYEPAPKQLLERKHTIQCFRLNLFVRFSPHPNGPALPLVFVGYWDPTRRDWMPYAFCTAFRVGSYNTLF